MRITENEFTNRVNKELVENSVCYVLDSYFEQNSNTKGSFNDLSLNQIFTDKPLEINKFNNLHNEMNMFPEEFNRNSIYNNEYDKYKIDEIKLSYQSFKNNIFSANSDDKGKSIIKKEEKIILTSNAEKALSSSPTENSKDLISFQKKDDQECNSKNKKYQKKFEVIMKHLKRNICYRVWNIIFSNEEAKKDEKFKIILNEIKKNFREHFTIKASKKFCQKYHEKSLWDIVKMTYTSKNETLEIDELDFSIENQKLLKKSFSFFMHEYCESRLMKKDIENLVFEKKQRYEYLAKNYEKYISTKRDKRQE